MLAIIAASIILFTACTGGKPEGPEIVIGEFSPKSGAEATFGQSTLNGVQLAVDELNSQGGINGQRIKLIAVDTRSEDQRTKQVVTDLIDKHKALALIGEISSDRSQLAGRVAQQKQIPMITPASTNPKVTQTGEYIFRSCFLDTQQGAALARFAYDRLKARKVAILKNKDSQYSRDLARYFAKTFKRLGGTLVSEHSYRQDDKEFTTQLERIRPHQPEVIFIPGYYNEVGYIARQIKQLEIKSTLLGGDGWDSDKLFEFAQEAINGHYFSNHFTAESDAPNVVEFVTAYREKFGTTPDGSAALGYDAAQVLIKAIKTSGDLTRQNIRKQLAQIKNLQGVTGKITIDNHRNAVKPVVILQIDGNVNRFITTVAP